MVKQSLTLRVSGLGIILYSPWAVAGIPPGSDYLSTQFWQGPDVARQVNACCLSGVGTGSLGDYHLHFYTGPLDDDALASAELRVRLGLEVRDRTVCVRDLYDLLSWDPVCPPGQRLELEDGFYRITAYTTTPPNSIVGDEQEIYLHFQSVASRPHLVHEGVPQLC
jgi:hypothetical protein